MIKYIFDQIFKIIAIMWWFCELVTKVCWHSIARAILHEFGLIHFYYKRILIDDLISIKISHYI